MIGSQFGRLTVLSEHPIRGGGRKIRYVCRCECGSEINVLGESLRLNRTVSCGCYARDRATEKNLRHGHSVRGAVTAEKRVYAAMKARCSNPNNIAYRHYGGRGIAVCERWSNSFEAFLSDMGERPSSQHSIDRIDNDRGYGPDNCRWATRSEQMANTRGARPVLRSDGRSYRTLKEAADDVGVTQANIGAVCRGRQATSGGYSWQYITLALLRALLTQEPPHGQ